MRNCPRCQGLIPPGADCPNCAAGAAAAPGWLRGLAAVAGGAALSVTLSACYGAPISDAPGNGYIPADPNMLSPSTTARGGAETGEGGTPIHHHDGGGRVVPGRPDGLDVDDPDARPCDCGADPPR